jgi:hypothetical protein
MLSGPITNHSQFSWKEISCFLRPQVVSCDAIARPIGSLFLFLTSFYRAWGIDGFYCSYAKRHFLFFQDFLEKKVGINLDLCYPAKLDEIVSTILSMLDRDGLVIIPVSRRYLSSSIYFDREDVSQYLVVTGYSAETDAFFINDNLHFGERDLSTRYGPAIISSAILKKSAIRYWDTKIETGSPTPHEETQYWIAHLTAKTHRQTYDCVKLRKEMAATYLSSVPFDQQQIDVRHLVKIEAAYRNGDASVLESLVRSYMADANAGALHLDILLSEMTCCVDADTQDLSDHLLQYKNESLRERTKFIVSLLASKNSISDKDWRSMRRQLMEMAVSIRNRFMPAVESLAMQNRAK